MSENDFSRKAPRQNRSLQRYNKILDAAAQVFEELGYEKTSTDLIAVTAQTSIGSLYRFFPDKAAIAHALAERYADKMEKMFLSYFSSSKALGSIEQIVSDTIESFDHFYANQPGCRIIMLQSLISGEIRSVNEKVDYKLAKHLEKFFAARNSTIDPFQCQIAAFVCVEVSNTLQLWSLKENKEFRKKIIIETKQVLIRYLKPLFP
jgi:AcrR family transcriptional regulator